MLRELRRHQESRKAQLRYYKRYLLTGRGYLPRIEEIETEYPVETFHIALGVWIREKLHLL